MGMPLEQLETEKGGEKAWTVAQEPLAGVAKLLHADDSGPYLLGAEVSYADFVLVSFLRFCVRLGDGGGKGDVFERFVMYDSAFEKVFEACEKWMESDSY